MDRAELLSKAKELWSEYEEMRPGADEFTIGVIRGKMVGLIPHLIRELEEEPVPKVGFGPHDNWPA